MTIKTGDFIEISYTGTVDGKVFDTTDLMIAKKEKIFNEKMHYGSMRIRVGEKLLLKGLDEDVVGKELNKSYKLSLSQEKAFGKRSPDLIRMIPRSKFTESGVNPVAGLSLNIDGVMASIKSVSGGRILVDFNHPLAGKEVDYEYKITKIITDDKEKVESVIAMNLGLKPTQYLIEVKDNKLFVDLKNKSFDPIKDDLRKSIGSMSGVSVEFK